MMWIKICGVTTLDDARESVSTGADAIGLNFFVGSKRRVDEETARAIVAALPPEVEPVGVFVNQSVEEIRRICSACGIRTAQLHGDEPPELAASLPEVAVIRAFRVDERNLEGLGDRIHRDREAGARLRACLVDAYVQGGYGGTGRTAPWSLLASAWNRNEWPPLILAGGLTPENVSEAVRAVRPWGVDVASGVESAPGRKDLDKVRRFIAACRESERRQ